MLAHGTGFVRPAEYLTQGISVPTAERAPLYPLVLAGLTKLGAGGADAQRLLGALTGAGTIAAAGLLGRRLAGERVGLLAAGLAAVYPTLVAADGALMTESLYGMLAALSLVAAYRLLDAPGAGRALVLGAIVALAALTRGEALLLFPLLLLPLVRRPGGLRAAAIACVAFAVVLAPWTARNWIEFDRPVLVATEGGETLEGANCDPVYYGANVGSWDYSCVRVSGRGNEAAELDKAGHRGVRYARDHLGRVPVVLAARLGRTWGLCRRSSGPRAGRAGSRTWAWRCTTCWSRSPPRPRPLTSPPGAALHHRGAAHHGHAHDPAQLRQPALPAVGRARARGGCRGRDRPSAPRHQGALGRAGPVPQEPRCPRRASPAA